MTAKENQPTGSAVAAVVAAQLTGFVATWIVLFMMAGGLGGFARWYSDGGFFMHLIVLLSLAQVAAGIGLGLGNLRRPLPLFVHFILPALAALAGILGTSMGMMMAFEAVLHAPPEMVGALMAASRSIAENTRVFGLVVAGFGCAALVATGLTGRDTARDRDDPEQRAVAFSQSLLAGLGGMLFVAAVGNAIAIHQLTVAFEAMASAPPDVRGALMAAGLEHYHLYSRLTLFATITAAIATAGLAATVSGGVDDWFGRRIAEGVVALLVVGTVLGSSLYVDSSARGGMAAIAELSASHPPQDILLPVSNSEQRFTGAPILALNNRGARLDGREIELDRIGLAAIRERADRGELDDPHLRRGQMHRAQEVPSGCPANPLPTFALAIDEATKMTKLKSDLAKVRAAGGCRVKLMVREGGEAKRSRRRALQDVDQGPVAEIIEVMDAGDQRMIDVILSATPTTRTRAAQEKPSLNLGLHIRDGLIAHSMGGDRGEGGDGGDSRWDLKTLLRELTELKGRFPQERQIYWSTDERAEINDLVRAIDVARGFDKEGRYHVLFDEVRWVIPLPGEAPSRFLPRATPDVLSDRGGRGDGPYPQVVGKLTREAVVEALGVAVPRINACHAELRATLPQLVGEMTVQTIVAYNGDVARVNVLEDTVDAPRLAECVRNVLLGVRFPTPQAWTGAEITHRYSFGAAGLKR